MKHKPFAWLWCICYQDRFRITAILGAHNGTLGSAALLLTLKGVYLGGLYDTWASGGGDIRLIKDQCVTLNPYVLGRYLARAPLGSEGWIISINSNLDVKNRDHILKSFILNSEKNPHLVHITHLSSSCAYIDIGKITQHAKRRVRN